MRYNNIQSGLSGIYGTPDVNENNIDIEPQFMDYNNNDFRLKSISPCINAGIPVTTGLGLPITDISGNERIFDGEVDIIDIGAYEFQDHPSPWDIVISNDSIEENSTPCNIVGILYTLHQDSTTTYTYTFDKDSVNPDTLFFSVSNDTLNTSNNLLDYEYKPIDNIYIKTTDNRGKSYTELISIQIINENEIPTGLALSKDSITENSAIGSIVGILNTTDEDISDTHNYTFASGDGINDMDSIYFDTDNNNLITKAEINFEAQQECKIVIRTTDGGGLFYDKPFVIYIININEPPVEINLSNDSIKYDAEPGTLVGEFSTIDEDINDTDHTYTFTSDEFVNSADSIYFNILDDSLLVAMDLDNEKLVYEFLVKSTDNGGLSLTEQFLINVIKAENIKLIKQLPGYIQIYPNPAKGYIIINPKEKQKTIEEIILINSQGEVVFSAYSLNTVNYNLDINDFSNGIYYLVIKLEGKYYYDKIIIFQ